MEQTQALLQLQEADITILRIRKKLDSLPQRKAISDNFKKHEELVAKGAQVTALLEKLNAQVEELQSEDARLAEQVANSRTTIDESHDYRLIASLTRDMETCMKRRDNIEFELGKLLENIEKAESISKLASEKIAETERRDAELVKSFRAAAADGQAQIDEAQKRREEAALALEPELMRRYDTLRRAKGGIGAGKLEDGRCSACRISLHEGQISRLLDGPDIGTCPSCNRMLVVRM